MQVTAMIIKKLRELRKAERLSQQEVGLRAGLRRSYISAVECRYAAPTLTALERWVKALGVGLHEFLYSGDGAAGPARPPEGRIVRHQERRLMGIFGRLGKLDRRLLLSVASDMARRQHPTS